MYLSKLVLRPDALTSERVLSMLGNPYNLHQEIWNLFGDHAGRRRDFLYRVDSEPGLVQAFTLSQRPPKDATQVWDIQTKSFSPALSAGDRLRISLRANPVVTRDGKRHDVVMDAIWQLRQEGKDATEWPSRSELEHSAGVAWLEKRAGKWGFSLLSETVHVYSYRTHELKKPNGRKIQLATLDFRGLLQVTDPDTFVSSLSEGFGPAKGFGCGLMLCKRES